MHDHPTVKSLYVRAIVYDNTHFEAAAISSCNISSYHMINRYCVKFFIRLP